MVKRHIQLMLKQAGGALWPLMMCLVLLAGCASRPPTEPASEPDVEPAAPMTAELELSGSPALALLERAHLARASGNDGSAGRLLERALNISPDSSWLYMELAQLRLHQGDFSNAEGFALRALRLAPDHDDYRADLWLLVAQAREQQGNDAGARQARQQADALRGLRGA